MKVIKRNNKKEEFKFDKIVARIKSQTYDLNTNFVDRHEIAKYVIQFTYDGITTKELDNLIAETAATMSSNHPDYSYLAGRILASSLQKEAPKCFSEAMEMLYNNFDVVTGGHAPRISLQLLEIVREHKDFLDSSIIKARDFDFDYQGFKTLEKSYLQKTSDGRIIETPQYLYLRCALGIHGTDFENVLSTYELLSTHVATHATPTLFNSGTVKPQLSSCFLFENEGEKIEGDSLEGLFEVAGYIAQTSKEAGGVGLTTSNIRARGSHIKGTGGQADGLMPMLRFYDSISTWINQCFHGDTRLITSNGQKEFRDLTKDDLLLTKDGTFGEIEEICKYRQKGEMIRIGIIGHGEDIIVTKGHPIWAKVDDRMGWVEAGELKNRDKIGVVYRIDPKEKKKVKSSTNVLDDIIDLKWFEDLQEEWDQKHPFNKDDNFLFREIARIEEYDEEYDEECDVYDVIMKNIEDPSYCIENALVHNGGKRKGAFAMYLEPWHSDVYEFLDAKKPTGAEEERARNLHYAMWIPNLFMERVFADQEWSLFSPNEAPGLHKVYDEPDRKDFTELYERYEKEGKARKVIKARDLFLKILESQIETGEPYIGYKDHVNTKNNQKNLGVISSSNLCIEILEYHGVSKKHGDLEQAVCNLASLALSKFVVKRGKKAEFDFQELYRVSKQMTRNLDKVIDVNHYPTEPQRRSNMRHRPIGLGVQGLADVFALMGYPYESQEAKDLNKKIFETIYFAGLEASNELAVENGTYESFEGSPSSQGILQYHMWGLTEDDLSGMWDFKGLIEKIKTSGLRNSLITAEMPTVSCLVSASKIKTKEGIKSYRQIMEENDIDWATIEKETEQRWIDFKEPLFVETRNGLKETKRIFYNGHVPIVKIELEDGLVIECSENHKFLRTVTWEVTTVSWVKTENLKELDDLVTTHGSLSLQIVNIEKIGRVKPTWDIEVEDGHEFLLENGVVTHNTSIILGNNESFEPFSNMIYLRRLLAGEFVMTNKHLVKDLIQLGLWNENIKKQIIMNDGSVQKIEGIPQHIKDVYKTAWEIKQRAIIDQAADRGPFVCQTQSMNLFVADPTYDKLYSMQKYAWERGLKTGQYYLRTKAATSALKGLGVDMSVNVNTNTVEEQINENIDTNSTLEDPKYIDVLFEMPNQPAMTDIEDYRLMLQNAKNAAQNGEECEMCSS